MEEVLKKIFLLGIGGTAMGNLASELKRRGWMVGGSDQAVYPPMSDVLFNAGIEISDPGDTIAMEKWSGGLFIIGNAVSRGHPQVEWLLQHPEEKYMSLAEFLEHHILRSTKNLVIAGTHGKSTTTAAAAWWLYQSGKTTGHLVGGVARNLDSGFHWPAAPDGYFVIEGDEYDTAFFDKRSKFVHYRPDVLVLNNLEFDHADIFRDLEDVKRSFRQVISLVPPGGLILYNGDDANLQSILPVNWTNCQSFGTGKDNDYLLTFDGFSGASSFRIQSHKRISPAIDLTLHHSLTGEYNARNLAGGYLGSQFLSGGAMNEAEVDFRNYNGLERRQDVWVQNERAILIEDFAHHPTSIGLTLRYLAQLYTRRRLVVVLEPRSNTLRTSIFQQELAEALSVAHAVVVAPIHRMNELHPDKRLDVEALSVSLKKKNTTCLQVSSFAQISGQIKVELSDGQPILLVVFTNGSMGGILPELKEICSLCGQSKVATLER